MSGQGGSTAKAGTPGSGSARPRIEFGMITRTAGAGGSTGYQSRTFLGYSLPKDTWEPSGPYKSVWEPGLPQHTFQGTTCGRRCRDCQEVCNVRFSEWTEPCIGEVGHDAD